MSCDPSAPAAPAATALPAAYHEDESTLSAAAARYDDVAAVLEAAASGQRVPEVAAAEFAPLIEALARNRLKRAARLSLELLCDVRGAGGLPRAQRVRPFRARALLLRRWLDDAPPQARARWDPDPRDLESLVACVSKVWRARLPASALRVGGVGRTVDAASARAETRQRGVSLAEAAARDDIDGVAEEAPAAWRAGLLRVVANAGAPAAALGSRLFGEVLECLAGMDQRGEAPAIADVPQASVEAAVGVVAVLRRERPPASVTGDRTDRPLARDNRVWAALVVRGVAAALPVVRAQIEDEAVGHHDPEASAVVRHRHLIRSLVEELAPRIGAGRAAALREGTDEAGAEESGPETAEGDGDGYISPAAAAAWRGMHDAEERYAPSLFRTRKSAVRPGGGAARSEDEVGGGAGAAAGESGCESPAAEESLYTERVAAVVRGADLARAGLRPLPLSRECLAYGGRLGPLLEAQAAQAGLDGAAVAEVRRYAQHVEELGGRFLLGWSRIVRDILRSGTAAALVASRRPRPVAPAGDLGALHFPPFLRSAHACASAFQALEAADAWRAEAVPSVAEAGHVAHLLDRALPPARHTAMRRQLGLHVEARTPCPAATHVWVLAAAATRDVLAHRRRQQYRRAHGRAAGGGDALTALQRRLAAYAQRVEEAARNLPLSPASREAVRYHAVALVREELPRVARLERRASAMAAFLDAARSAHPAANADADAEARRRVQAKRERLVRRRAAAAEARRRTAVDAAAAVGQGLHIFALRAGGPSRFLAHGAGGRFRLTNVYPPTAMPRVALLCGPAHAAAALVRLRAHPPAPPQLPLATRGRETGAACVPVRLLALGVHALDGGAGAVKPGRSYGAGDVVALFAAEGPPGEWSEHVLSGRVRQKGLDVVRAPEADTDTDADADALAARARRSLDLSEAELQRFVAVAGESEPAVGALFGQRRVAGARLGVRPCSAWPVPAALVVRLAGFDDAQWAWSEAQDTAAAVAAGWPLLRLRRAARHRGHRVRDFGPAQSFPEAAAAADDVAARAGAGAGVRVLAAVCHSSRGQDGGPPAVSLLLVAQGPLREWWPTVTADLAASTLVRRVEAAHCTSLRYALPAEAEVLLDPSGVCGDAASGAGSAPGGATAPAAAAAAVTAAPRPYAVGTVLTVSDPGNDAGQTVSAQFRVTAAGPRWVDALPAQGPQVRAATVRFLLRQHQGAWRYAPATAPPSWPGQILVAEGAAESHE